jgi:hypothetical protein
LAVDIGTWHTDPRYSPAGRTDFFICFFSIDFYVGGRSSVSKEKFGEKIVFLVEREDDNQGDRMSFLKKIGQDGAQPIFC